MGLKKITLTVLVVVLSLTSCYFTNSKNLKISLLKYLLSNSIVLAQEQENLDNEEKADEWIKEGSQYYQNHQLKEALQAWQKALKIYRQLSLNDEQALALGNLGIVYRELGNYDKSINHLNQSLAIYQTMSNKKGRQGVAIALDNLGNTYKILGQYHQAIKYYDRSLKITEELEDIEGKGATLANRGGSYAQLGQYTEAIRDYQASLNIAEKLNNPNMKGSVLHNLGSVYQSQGKINEALNNYNESLNIAINNNNKRLERSVLGSIGIAHRMFNDYNKAIDYSQQSLEIAREIGDPQKIAIGLNNLGHNQLSLGKLIEAEKSLREAIQKWDEIRSQLDDDFQISQFETLITYILLLRVLVAQERYEEALEIAEHGRSRAFVNLLSKKLPEKFDELLDKNKIKQIAQEKKATIVEYFIIPEELDQIVHEAGSLQAQGKAKELYIWVVQPTGKIHFRKVDVDSQNINLKQLIKTSRHLMGVRGRNSITIVFNDNVDPTSQLQKLHQLLINPIADLLPKDSQEQVIFIPHRDLFLVPFPALQDEQKEYLIEKHTILTAPAIQILDLTRQQKQKLTNSSSEKVLVVGNPKMPTVLNLQPLPQAQVEAENIAKLFGQDSILLINEQATETTIKNYLPQARIIHLATHGLLDTDEASNLTNSINQTDRDIAETIELNSQLKNGAIALTPSQEDNGLLTYEEILNLNLQADLVILSACDTGRGEITGDGVIGLSRSFITAGTPSIIVSLWSVPDAETALLMTQFYRNVQEKKLDKAQALRQAMLTVMQDHRDPRKWAAFTLIGEP